MLRAHKMNKRLTANIAGVLIVVLVVTVSAVISSHTQIPVTGIVGKSVNLPCKINASPQTLANVKWVDLVYNSDPNPQTIFGSSSNPQFLIFSSHPNSVNYRVDSDYTLTILEVTLDDPGKYMCISTLTNATTITKEYYLSVATMPTCSGNTELKTKEDTQLECSMEFSGMQPAVNWYKNGEVEKSVDLFDIMLAKKRIDIHATHNDDNVTYTCKFTFNDRDESCNLTLNVRYLIPGVHITIEKEKLRPGDDVKCSAKGNPTPEIMMRPHRESDKSGPGWKTFSVGNDLVGQNLTIHCEASNSVDEVTEIRSMNKTILVHAQKKVQHTTTTTKATTTKTITATKTTTGGTPVKKTADIDVVNASEVENLQDSTDNMKDEAETENMKVPAETGKSVEPKPVITKEVNSAGTGNSAAKSQCERRQITQAFISIFFSLLIVLL